jgi:hypothetical protein
MASAHYSSFDERSTAQAVKLVRALCDQLHEMTRELARLERQGVTATSRRASAIRQAAAALRRDINEAQILIDRLERRYVNGDERTQQRPPRRQPRATADRHAK